MMNLGLSTPSGMDAMIPLGLKRRRMSFFVVSEGVRIRSADSIDFFMNSLWMKRLRKVWNCGNSRVVRSWMVRIFFMWEGMRNGPMWHGSHTASGLRWRIRLGISMNLRRLSYPGIGLRGIM